MNKGQAGAAAQALLDPELQAQEAVRRQRARKQAIRARQQRVAMWGLVFAVAGAGVAYLCEQRWLFGALAGALVGYLLGWMFTRRRS